MPRFRWLAAVVLLSVLTRSAFAQAPLAWRWQQQDAFYVEWKTYIDTARKTADAHGQLKADPKAVQRMSEDLTTVYRVALLNRHADGAVDLEIQVESVKGTILEGRVDPRLLAGHTLRVALDARMNLVRLEGLDPVLHKRFGEGPLPPQAGFFRTELEDACRSWLQDVLIPLPNRPVQAGEKWEQQTEKALVPLGRHVLRKTFAEGGKVAGSGRELTRLTVTASSTLVPYRDGEFQVPYKVTRGEFKSASYSGTYFFDPAAGRLVQGETRLRTCLHAILTAEGRDNEGEAEQEYVTTVRLLDHKPVAEPAPSTDRATVAGQPPADADLPCRHLLGPEDSRLTAQREQRIAELTEAGLWGEALKLSRQVLELRVRVQGARHWQAADAARNVQTLERLVTLSEADRAEFLGIPRVLQEAERLRKQGKEAEGEALCDKAWAVRLRIFGEEHHSTARLYGDLAAALHAQGKRAEAQAVCEKALDIARRVLGEEHPDTARSYNDLGCLLLEQGKAAEAEPLLRRGVEIGIRLHGETAQTAKTYDNLGVSLNNQNRCADAQPMHERALAIARRVLGEDARDTMECTYNLAVNLVMLNRPAEAEPLLRRTLAFRVRTLGEAHMGTALNYSNLAGSLMQQKRLADAEPLLRKSLEIHRRVLGDGHMDTIRTYGHLGLLLRSLGKEQEGAELLRRGEELFRRGQGER
jgi:tetratricopeptide (TPR) repeat protein